jgi:hypothetical protein
MDFVKVQEANAACRTLIEKALEPGAARDHLGVKDRTLLEHCLDMIEKMRDWPASRLEKSFRWLGYIQGVMEALGVADLETLKQMNAPTEADTARENAAKDKAKTEASKLADKLEIHVSAGSYPEEDEKFFSECVAALRGELPEPSEGDHAFNVLSKELQRRLHPTSPAYGLMSVSTDELIALTNLAERLEQVKRERTEHREMLTSLKSVAGLLGPWLTKEVPEPLPPQGVS